MKPRSAEWVAKWASMFTQVNAGLAEIMESDAENNEVRGIKLIIMDEADAAAYQDETEELETSEHN